MCVRVRVRVIHSFPPQTKTALRTAALQPLDRPTTVTLAELMATNPHLRTIRTEMGELQTAIHESTQLATDIKLWIQLNIPRIEDGNNFGVGIQESIVQELSRAEDAGLAAAEGLGRWWVTRSKLVGKVVKYAAREQCPHAHPHAHPHGHGQNCPSCQLYTNDPAVYALLDGDQRFLATLWMSWVDLRNNYAILHDLLSKNLEKLVNPRSEHASSMY